MCQKAYIEDSDQGDGFSLQLVTMQKTSGLLGPSGPPALQPVAMAFSSEAAPATVSIIAARDPPSRPAPATCKNVIRDVSASFLRLENRYH